MPTRPKNARGKGDGDSPLDPHCAHAVARVAFNVKCTSCSTPMRSETAFTSRLRISPRVRYRKDPGKRKSQLAP